MPHYKPKSKKTPKVRRPVKRGGGPLKPRPAVIPRAPFFIFGSLTV